MFALLYFVLAVLASPFKSKIRLEAENAALRHQLIVCGVRYRAGSGLRAMIAGSFQLYRLFPSILLVLTIIHPETLVRWHRAGFLLLALEVVLTWRASAYRDRRMSIENPLWGASGIELSALRRDFNSTRLCRSQQACRLSEWQERKQV